MMGGIIGRRVIYDTTGPKQAERSKKMRAALDKKRFGPWALVTGASSGIGEEFARQIAVPGIHVALVGQREPLLRLALNAFGRLVSSTVSSLSTFPSLTSSRCLQMPRVISTSALSSPMLAPEIPASS